jgi:type IV secretory pathway VirJ component
VPLTSDSPPLVTTPKKPAAVVSTPGVKVVTTADAARRTTTGIVKQQQSLVAAPANVDTDADLYENNRTAGGATAPTPTQLTPANRNKIVNKPPNPSNPVLMANNKMAAQQPAAAAAMQKKVSNSKDSQQPSEYDSPAPKPANPNRSKMLYLVEFLIDLLQINSNSFFFHFFIFSF